MRTIVFFDLPVETSKDKKEYRLFRKFLIKKGFIMLQYSVYSKISLNQTGSKNLEKLILANTPEKGVVQILTVTEKQFSRMKLAVGDIRDDVICDDSRLVVI